MIWDLHASYRHELEKAEANNLNINLSFIPAGQTDPWQPLDCSIFGIVKKQPHQKFQELSFEKEIQNIDIIDTIVILLEVWNSIDSNLIRKSWNNLKQ